MKAALWARVSTSQQELDNQLRALTEEAERRGLSVVATYSVEESAWRGPQALDRLLQDARRRRFQVVLVWALDRLTREGPLRTLELVHRLGGMGVQVVSLQESWTEASGELRDLLLAIAGWVARMESQRRSERTRAGLARAVAQGKRLGRPPGAKDRRRRKKSGYYRRWALSHER